MANLQSLTFGPFTRSVTSVEGHLAPPESLAAGSYNYLIDPVAGGAFKRSGNVILGDTVSAIPACRAVNGILESKPGYVPCRLRSFKSDALADGALGGYPTPSVLYRREASSTSWPTVDDGIFGTEYVRRTSANYVLLSEYGAINYPTTGGALGAEIKYKVAPFWYESGDGGYSRGATEFTRRFVASGSWDTLDAGRWRHYPNLRGTPLRWDGGCNNSAASISNSIRVMPTGPLPPAWMPTLTETSSVAVAARTSSYQWSDGDAFFFSVIYQFEDGSYSAPVIPRQPNATLTGGYGWKVVGAIPAVNAWKTIEWTGIPRGPDGTIARILLRSRKMTFAAATDKVTVDISDLRVCGVLRNNTQTAYSDSLADDDGLLLDGDVVRYDTIMPPRARYIGTGDNRCLIGYTLPNQTAIQIVIQQIGVTAFDQNIAEDSAGTSAALGGAFSITGSGASTSTLNLHSTNAGAAVVSTVAITLSDTISLQSVVDQINATARDATHVAFRAQLAPGADGSIASSSLCRTVLTTTATTSAASTTLTVDGPTCAAIPIGSFIYDANAKIGAGTYVTEKLTATTLKMSAAASGVGSSNISEFYCDTGDNPCILNGRGIIRCYGPWLPSFIYFKRSALPGYDRPAKDRIYFTSSSPGTAATGVSLAAGLFAAGNRRDGVNSPGQVMGFADIQGAAVVLYRKRVALFINERGANTAEDFDCRIQTINDTRGCVSPWSVVAVNGCAVYATNVGIVATDKSKREILLTADIYQPIRGKGDMSYEFPRCVAAAAADSPDCWMAGAAWGNRLVYAFRTLSTAYNFMLYDFSLGTDAVGMDSLADPEKRKPYGWSSLCSFASGASLLQGEFGARAFGAVSGTDGLWLYGAVNDNSGTADGRVDRYMKPTQVTDNGVVLYGQVSSKEVLSGANRAFSAQNATVLSKIPYAGCNLHCYRGSGSESIYALSSSSTNDYSIQAIELSQGARSPFESCRVVLEDGVSDEGGLLWRVDVEVDVLPTIGG